MSASVEIERRGADVLDELEPLWLTLKNHHGACTPDQAIHDDATSWAQRREEYAHWVAEEGSFFLVARAAGLYVTGYHFARPRLPLTTAASDARTFASMMGNVKAFILGISGAVVFEILLVSGNTMAMSIRERVRELAVLKAIGYTDTFILLFVIAESLLVAALGIAAGLALMALLLPGIEGKLSGILQFVSLPPQKVVEGVVITLFIAFIAGIFPAINASRLRVVDAIRRV